MPFKISYCDRRTWQKQASAKPFVIWSPCHPTDAWLHRLPPLAAWRQPLTLAKSRKVRKSTWTSGTANLGTICPAMRETHVVVTLGMTRGLPCQAFRKPGVFVPSPPTWCLVYLVGVDAVSDTKVVGKHNISP